MIMITEVHNNVLPLEIMNDRDSGDYNEEEESDGLFVTRQQSAIDPHAGETLGGDLRSAVLGIIKGMVGPAILYLPHGFAHAGYLVAIPILFLSAALFLASSSCLLESWKLVSSMSVAVSNDDADNDGDDVHGIVADQHNEQKDS